jgi:hypothetical protein
MKNVGIVLGSIFVGFMLGVVVLTSIILGGFTRYVDTYGMWNIPQKYCGGYVVISCSNEREYLEYQLEAFDSNNEHDRYKYVDALKKLGE